MDSISTVDFLTTDIAATPSCASQEKLAMQQCAGVGHAYDAANLKCLAEKGVLNSLFHDPNTVRRGDQEPAKVTLRCAEGQTSIDSLPNL